jgi:hypothetical protein
MIVAK